MSEEQMGGEARQEPNPGEPANPPQRPGGEDRKAPESSKPGGSGDTKIPSGAHETTFGDVTSDPRMRAFDESQSRAADQAYMAGIRSLRSGAAAFLPDGTFHGDFMFGGTKYVTQVLTAPEVTAPAGTVREAVLAHVRGVYVPAPAHEQALQVLWERRLLVLRGEVASGRATTALHLLDAVAAGAVSRLDPSTDPRTIQESAIQEGRGYLLELPAGGGGPTLVEAHLDALCALLDKRRAYCVLIVDRHPRYRGSMGGCVVDHSPPDPAAVLHRHATWVLRHRHDPQAAHAPAEVADEPAEVADEPSTRMRGAVSSPELREALGSSARVADVTSVTGALVAHALGEMDFEELVARCGQSVELQVQEWFAELGSLARSERSDEALRTASFRIALAVLDDTPYHLVVEAAEQLAERLMVAIWPRRLPGRPVFADDRRARLEEARATLVDGQVEVGDAMVPAEFVVFEDRRLSLAVLGHVWRSHHNLRRPMSEWLLALGRHPNALLSTRAALAAGQLCAFDFQYSFHELIKPCAGSRNYRDRLFAAWALDQAASNERIQAAIRSILRQWARASDPEEDEEEEKASIVAAQRWTTAAALGYDVGRRFIDSSLSELQRLGTWREGRLRSVASQSIADLFIQGSVEEVVERLERWLADRRKVRRDLGLLVVLRLAAARVRDVWSADARSLPEEWERWPLLLALATDSPPLRRRLADLLWQTLNTARSRQSALLELRRWFRCAASDRACLDVLCAFLPLLIDDQADRLRLLEVVTVMRRNAENSLNAVAAARLRAAIDLSSDTEEKAHEQPAMGAAAGTAGRMATEGTAAG